ncbi:ECF-type sigma factor [Ideonella sp. DXS22W]|uniref:ECF-type sigma factor n=1 Tax=Pseudaquabacterium inlustre TaxID=2984192 RepID=A0ABU9CE86_9BURK
MPPDTPAALPPAWAAAYPELKKIARARLHAAVPAGAPVAGLNTTALVHESFLRLAQRLEALQFSSHGHFYAYASQVMRSVIVDLVREQQAQRRGGDLQAVTLDTALSEALATPADGTETEAEALRVDAALTALARVEPRLAQVVEMRYFAGMNDLEIAQALGLTDRTVRRDWDKARALLRTMLAG